MGRHDVLALLLRTGGNGGDGVGKEERSAAFLAAARGGHEQCLRVLLEASPSPSSTAALLQAADQGYGEYTALIFAAHAGHVGCVRLLLQHSPDAQVTHRSRAGWNALHCTCFNGREKCLALLLQHSPDAQLAAMTDSGDTAATLAARFAPLSCLRLLLQQSPRLQRLDTALVRTGEPWGRQWQWGQEGGAAANEPYQLCLELLLSKGAMLTAEAPPGAFALVRPVIQDLAARALVPDMAYEAAVQAVQEAKRCGAASKGLPFTRPTMAPAEVAAVVEQFAVATV